MNARSIEVLMKYVRHSAVSAAFFAGLIAATATPAQTVVPTPRFTSVELEGGGYVLVRHGSTQLVRLMSGSTAFTSFDVDGSGKLRIEACNSDCPHHYDLKVEITTPAIDALAISGGGVIEGAEGFPRLRNLSLAVKGGGTIDARAMDTAGATAAVDGGGRIWVKADDRLTAAINGGGKIKYLGNPRMTEAVMGGGKVERGD
jgi:hypothetical protein